MQYGHARIASIFRNAQETLGAGPLAAGFAAHNCDLRHASEMALARKLLELPEIVALVAATLQPHHYTTYACAICGIFSRFYDDCRILKQPDAILFSRLRLAKAAQLTLARVLRLMGMETPGRM